MPTHTQRLPMRPQGELSLTLPLWLFDFIARRSLGKNKYLETRQRSTASWPHPGQHPLLNTQATLLTPHSPLSTLSLLFSRCDFLFLFLSAWENLWPFVWSERHRAHFSCKIVFLWAFFMLCQAQLPPLSLLLSLSHSFSGLVSILDLFVWVAKCRNLRTLAR